MKFVHRKHGKGLISFSHKGNFEKTNKYFEQLTKRDYIKTLEMYGEKGVSALSAATPVRTGKTASSWDYKIDIQNDKIELWFINTNINKGENIALLIQYGHGTKSGKYIRGRDYINPALQPVFDEMAETIWKEVNEV